MTNGEKRKFSPQNNSAKQKEAALNANADLVSSLSVTEYKYAMSAVSRFLDPESSTNDDICTFQESGRSSTIFRPKIVQDVNVGPSGYFRVVSNPRFYRPLGMTDFSKPLSSNYQASRIYTIKQGADVRMVIPYGKPSNVPLTYYPATGYHPLPAAEMVDYDSKSVFLPEWNDDANGGGWFTRFSQPRSCNFTLRLDCWRMFGVPSVIVTAMIVGGAYVSNTLTPVASTEQNLGFIFQHSWTDILGFTIHVSTPTAILSHTTTLFFDANNVDPDEQCIHFVDSGISSTVQDAADAYINLGMSCWLQYTGADLVNGGETAGYRFPPDNLAKYSSLRDSYTVAASTPGALVGKIKKGAWAFYLPQNAAEMDFKPLEAFDNLGYILINGKKNSEDASIRVNFNQVLLVSTTNQAFSKQIVPACPNGLAVAISMLRLCSGVIENDGHQEKIRKIKAFLKSNYPAIKKGIKTIGQVAKAAAPIAAALL